MREQRGLHAVRVSFPRKPRRCGAGLSLSVLLPRRDSDERCGVRGHHSELGTTWLRQLLQYARVHDVATAVTLRRGPLRQSLTSAL